MDTSKLKEVLPNPDRRNWVWFAIQFVLRPLFSVWLQYRCRGHEKLSGLGGVLLVANHQSFLDPLLVGLPLCRPVGFLARDTLFRTFIVGWVLRSTNVLPINRNVAATNSIRQMVLRLQFGHIVGIFPEGTRSDDGQLGVIKPGLISVLKRTNVPVCPVAIAGATQALGRKAKFLHRTRVRVLFGDLIPADQIAAAISSGEDVAHQLISGHLHTTVDIANSWRDDDL